MKKRIVAAALALAMALGAGAVVGCSGQPQKEDVNADVPPGAPPLMPPGHEGRFEQLGANGCYGCHGANDLANPMLTGSTALPEDHYEGGSSSTQELNPTHDQCITCHSQG